MRRISKGTGCSDTTSAAHVTQGRFTAKSRESEPDAGFDESPLMVAQREKIATLFGGVAQRQETEEEALQGRFEAAQRVEDEEPLQGKFATAQRIEEEPSQGKFAAQVPAQRQEDSARKPNDTGLPDNLKSGIEALSGMSMDNVRVHYSSSQPAQLNALAYAQGTDIHVAPGQEKHLPHEAWHVVQQAQGRVRPTMQMKDGVPVNDDAGLEREADVMGERALQRQYDVRPEAASGLNETTQRVAQRFRPSDFDTYDAAKSANVYAGDHLDSQKNDLLSEHIDKGFGATERNNIYKTNKAGWIDGQIHSDKAPYPALHLQDTSSTPHVDHRFPKSKAGTNSFANAAVIPADKNISKSDKLLIGSEPTVALAPYASLDDSKYNIMKGADFSGAQKQEIYDANRRFYRNEGFDLANDEALSDNDEDGDLILSGYDSSQVPNIDHITPKSDLGTNYYFNAQVLPADVNIRKGGVKKKKFSMDMEDDSAEFEEDDELVNRMTLETYYKWKNGAMTDLEAAGMDKMDSEEEL